LSFPGQPCRRRTASGSPTGAGTPPSGPTAIERSSVARAVRRCARQVHPRLLRRDLDHLPLPLPVGQVGREGAQPRRPARRSRPAAHGARPRWRRARPRPGRPAPVRRSDGPSGGVTPDFAAEIYEIREMFELRSARRFVELAPDAPARVRYSRTAVVEVPNRRASSEVLTAWPGRQSPCRSSPG
jgi:hypothetical protein